MLILWVLVLLVWCFGHHGVSFISLKEHILKISICLVPFNKAKCNFFFFFFFRFWSPKLLRAALYVCNLFCKTKQFGVFFLGLVCFHMLEFVIMGLFDWIAYIKHFSPFISDTIIFLSLSQNTWSEGVVNNFVNRSC